MKKDYLELVAEAKSLIRHDLTLLGYNIDNILRIINSVKERLFIEESVSNMRKTFDLKLNTSQFYKKQELSVEHSKFIDMYLNEEFSLKKIREFESDIQFLISMIDKKDFCEVDLFSEDTIRVKTC